MKESCTSVGSIGHSNLSCMQLHPIICHSNYQIIKMFVRAEHLHLLHVGLTMLALSIGVRFHIIGGKKVIGEIARVCVTYRQYSARPQPQIMGRLLIEQVAPGMIFEKVRVYYAGTIYVKYGHIHKPTILKAYVCVFVSLTVKPAHLE